MRTSTRCNWESSPHLALPGDRGRQKCLAGQFGQPRLSWRVLLEPSGHVERYWLFRQRAGWALLATIRSTGEQSLDWFDTLLDVQVHLERRVGPEVWAHVSAAAEFSAHDLYEAWS